MAEILAEGLDYSAGHLDRAAITAARIPARDRRQPPRPVGFVVRYIDHPSRLGRKHTSPTEYAQLRAAGVEVLLVCERQEDDWRGGRAFGRQLAQDARAGADLIGYPHGGPIFLTADMHLSASQLPTALEFFRGGQDILGPAAGGYGFSELIDALVHARVCRWLWQTGSRTALRPAAHIYQCNDRPNITVAGVACDINEQYLPIAISAHEEDDITMDAETRAYLDKQFAALNHGLGVVIWGDAPDNQKNPDGTAKDRGGHPFNLEAIRNGSTIQAKQIAELAATNRVLVEQLAAQNPNLTAEQITEAVAAGVVRVRVEVTGQPQPDPGDPPPAATPTEGDNA